MQYDRFKAERTQPFRDLLEFVEPRPGMRAVDLGCGTGELTAELHRRLGPVETLGLDNSDAMLSRSAPYVEPGLRFTQGDIASFADLAASGRMEPYDLVFSNAAIHWVPDHRVLVPKLAAAVAPGGQLAIQVPANFHRATHRVAAELALEEPYAAVLDDPAEPSNVLAPEEYAELLHAAGFERQIVRLNVYGHLLEDRDQVAEWTRGSLLTAYERKLGPDLFPGFLEEYRRRLRERLNDERPYFFTFNRILFWGSRES